MALCRRRFTAQDDHRMARAGVLTADDRVEQIDGKTIAMPPIEPTHAWAVIRAKALLGALVGGRALVWPQSPVRLDVRNGPQPDLAVPGPGEYRSGLPEAPDVLPIVEGADRSTAQAGGIRPHGAPGRVFRRSGCSTCCAGRFRSSVIPRPGATA